MDGVLPMQPLLRAPTARCEVSVAAPDGQGAPFSATVTNRGKPPCLYMRFVPGNVNPP